MLCAKKKSFADFPQMEQTIEFDEKDNYTTLEESMKIGTRQNKQLTNNINNINN